jgi:hypothetical protein
MAMMAMFRGCFFHSCTIARCGVCTHDAGVAVSAVRSSSLGVLARVAVGADRSSSLGVLTSHPHRIHTSHPHNLFPCFFCEIDSFRTISKVLVYFVLWELMEQPHGLFHGNSLFLTKIGITILITIESISQKNKETSCKD